MPRAPEENADVPGGGGGGTKTETAAAVERVRVLEEGLAVRAWRRRRGHEARGHLSSAAAYYIL